MNIFKSDLILIYSNINKEPVVQYPNTKSVGLRVFFINMVLKSLKSTMVFLLLFNRPVENEIGKKSHKLTPPGVFYFYLGVC